MACEHWRSRSSQALAGVGSNNRVAGGRRTGPSYDRRLRYDYGYRMDIPKGWYILGEREAFEFLPYTERRFLNITTYGVRPPFSDRNTELSALANYIWNRELPNISAANWTFFQKYGMTRVAISGQEFYRREYRARWSSEFCILRYVAMVSLSSSYHGNPRGFATSNNTCEDSLSTHSTERETLLNSFRP